MVLLQTVHNRDQLVFLFSCMISGISTIALTTLLTLFATSTLNNAPIHTLALVTAVVDILALAALLVFTLVQSWRSHSILLRTGPQVWTVIIVVILPCLVASVLSICVLAWMANHHRHFGGGHDPWTQTQLLYAALAMWAVSLVAQSLFFLLCFMKTPSLPDTVLSSSEIGVYSIGSARKERQPIAMAAFTPPSYPRSVPESPTHSVFTISPMASVRTSVTSFLRPVTSKSRLIPPRKDSFCKETASPITELPSEPVRQEDGFETWEVNPRIITPDPDPSTQRPSHHSLETIPGSRPVSPARPLNGPFPTVPALPENVPLPESPQPALLDVPRPARLQPDLLDPSSASDVHVVSVPGSPDLTSLSRTLSPPFASGSTIRRPSPTNPQSHIHPLFRTDSPTPPPTASPGTILTASPWGGQVVSADGDYPLSPRGRKNSAISRHGDDSRPASPAVSLRPSSARSRSRPGSAKGTGTQLMPLMSRSHSHGDLREAQRSVSALERRAPTPPLPDLVLIHRRQASS